MSKVCLVGGGAISGCYARHLDNRGQNVVVLCRNFPATLVGETYYYSGVDTTDEGLMARTFEQVGPMDAMVVLAANHKDGLVRSLTVEAWESTVTTVLRTAFLAVKHGLPRMNPSGTITLVGSVMGSQGGHGCCNYAAAKKGLEGLMLGVVRECWEANQVRINLLELGYVEAGMGHELPQERRAKVADGIPMKRFASTQEVCQALDFLTAPQYCTGTVLTLAGGLR